MSSRTEMLCTLGLTFNIIFQKTSLCGVFLYRKDNGMNGKSREGYVDVVAAVMCCDGEVFAAERSYGHYEGYWEYPGGKVEKGESFEEALIREISEELDLDIRLQDLRYFRTFYHEYPSIKVALHIYLLDHNAEGAELKVHHESKWFNSDNLNDVQWLESTYYINDALVEAGVITSCKK